MKSLRKILTGVIGMALITGSLSVSAFAEPVVLTGNDVSVEFTDRVDYKENVVYKYEPYNGEPSDLEMNFSPNYVSENSKFIIKVDKDYKNGSDNNVFIYRFLFVLNEKGELTEESEGQVDTVVVKPGESFVQTFDSNRFAEGSNYASNNNNCIYYFAVEWGEGDNSDFAVRVAGDTSAYKEDAVKAIPATAKLMVDGKPVQIEGYNVAGNNFYKLRDFAYIMNDTKNHFDIVVYKGGGLHIDRDKEYTPTGAELQLGDGSVQYGKYVEILFGGNDGSEGGMNGAQASTEDGILIHDNNFMQIRTLAAQCGAEVSYDSATNSINIITEK